MNPADRYWAMSSLLIARGALGKRRSFIAMPKVFCCHMIASLIRSRLRASTSGALQYSICETRPSDRIPCPTAQTPLDHQIGRAAGIAGGHVQAVIGRVVIVDPALGLPERRTQRLIVDIDVDTRPPKGFGIEPRREQQHVPLEDCEPHGLQHPLCHRGGGEGGVGDAFVARGGSAERCPQAATAIGRRDIKAGMVADDAGLSVDLPLLRRSCRHGRRSCRHQ